VVGYTTGVFDLFHIGHLNLLRNARALCDRLIVGVTTDELLIEYKKKKPIIPFIERCEILRSIRYVDSVIAQPDMDKILVWKKLKFDVMFVGDDWYATEIWKKIEEEFLTVGVRIVYFPYTQGTSSTLLNRILVDTRKDLEITRRRLRVLLEEKQSELGLDEDEIEDLMSKGQDSSLR
jgi:glycerol-3-phosphate cytidylyltransferase